MSTTLVPCSNDDALLTTLYRAVGHEARWADVLRALAEYFGASVAMLRAADRRQCAHSYYLSYNLSDSVSRAYADYWWPHDPWTPAAFKSEDFRVRMTGRGSDLVSLRDLRQTRFYKEFLLRIPVEHLLLSVMTDKNSDDSLGSPPAILSLLRAPDMADFSDAEVEHLCRLTPHIQRAFKLHWQWRSSQVQLSVFQRSLDGLDFGVIFFDATGRILSLNTSAKEMIVDTDYRQFFTSLPQVVPAGGMLDGLVQKTAAGEGGPLTLCGFKNRLLAFALPIAHVEETTVNSKLARSAVMLMLVDQQKQPGAAVDFMVRSFKLSPAEAKILPLLFDSRTPTEMADILGLKISTIRSQLSSVYAKTGTTRQQELILLLGSAPPVRTPSSSDLQKKMRIPVV